MPPKGMVDPSPGPVVEPGDLEPRELEPREPDLREFIMAAKLLGTWTEFTDFNLKRQAIVDAFSTNGEKRPMAQLSESYWHLLPCAFSLICSHCKASHVNG